jgi:hypothetical protein
LLESQETRSNTLFELFWCASPRGCRVRTCSLHLVSLPVSRTLTCDESEPWLGGKDAAGISSAAGHWVWALALTRPPNVSRSRLHRKEFDRRSTRLPSLDNHVTHVRQEPNIAPAICGAIEGLHTAPLSRRRETWSLMIEHTLQLRGKRYRVILAIIGTSVK